MFMIFSSELFMLGNGTPEQQIKDSKSSFFEKRKSLKSYMEKQLQTEHAKVVQREEGTNRYDREKPIQPMDGINDIRDFRVKPIQLPQAELLQPLSRGHAPPRRRRVKEIPRDGNNQKALPNPQRYHRHPTNATSSGNSKILTAFLETQTFESNIKPLPNRTTKASMLEKLEFPQVQRCSTFLEDFGRFVVDNFSAKDPFLPWLHDFFITPDATSIKFIAQNRRNCQTGEGTEGLMSLMSPQIALFQPVPLQVLSSTNKNDANNNHVNRTLTETSDGHQNKNHDNDNEPTYRLATNHDNATVKETRFICRFHNAINDRVSFTLSKFPFNYELVTFRKNKKLLEEESSKGALNQSPFWLSQLLFECPVPKEFQSLVEENGEPKLFVDLIPIRTPARTDFLLTKDHVGKKVLKENSNKLFHLADEYGQNHILPKVKDSGRWANLPICSSAVSFSSRHVLDSNYAEAKVGTVPRMLAQPSTTKQQMVNSSTAKPHRLVACTWTSASYQRRGNSVIIRDSHSRLREFILFHKMVGFDHLYIYDNSPSINDMDESSDSRANSNSPMDLEAVVREFPSSLVTYVRWPCTICNNNRPMHKHPGDRSSQYAAEASCRERFGPLTEWMSFMDTDGKLLSTVTDF